MSHCNVQRARAPDSHNHHPVLSRWLVASSYCTQFTMSISSFFSSLMPVLHADSEEKPESEQKDTAEQEEAETPAPAEEEEEEPEDVSNTSYIHFRILTPAIKMTGTPHNQRGMQRVDQMCCLDETFRTLSGKSQFWPRIQGRGLC